jgi:polysaccharide biosynthesis/export protein
MRSDREWRPTWLKRRYTEAVRNPLAVQVRELRRGLRLTGALALSSCLTGLLIACASGSRGAIEVDQLKDAVDASAAHEYVIGIGDALSIQVYTPDQRDERVSGRMSVRSDGRISMQFINEIQAAGKTALGLAHDIETGLKSQIKEPLVTVTVDVSSPLSISVLGEVTKPGVQTVPPNAGVADALAAAGGLTQFAHKNGIFVVRARPQPQRIHFTYDALTKSVGRASLFRLQPGDVVVVE